jgi:hypothetical protein
MDPPIGNAALKNGLSPQGKWSCMDKGLSLAVTYVSQNEVKWRACRKWGRQEKLIVCYDVLYQKEVAARRMV